MYFSIRSILLRLEYRTSHAKTIIKWQRIICYSPTFQTAKLQASIHPSLLRNSDEVRYHEDIDPLEVVRPFADAASLNHDL